MNTYETFSEVALVELINEKDKLAFNELYRRYWKQMYVYLRKFVPDKEQCEDTVQDVFLSLWINGFPSPQTQVSSYLYSAVRYRIFDYFDKNKVVSKFEASLKTYLDKSESTPESHLILKEMDVQIEKEILALPVKMRQVFLLRRAENLSYKEIAAFLRISDKTVKKQLSNATKTLLLKLSSLMLLLLLMCS